MSHDEPRLQLHAYLKSLSGYREAPLHVDLCFYVCNPKKSTPYMSHDEPRLHLHAYLKSLSGYRGAPLHEDLCFLVCNLKQSAKSGKFSKSVKCRKKCFKKHKFRRMYSNVL